jgi:3-carboxy-cis,cis-muconate cycloisomerase
LTAEGAGATGLLGPLFRWDRLEAILSERARIQAMLDFEAALARAEARLGIIPVEAADAIAASCSAERIDAQTLAREAALAGNLAIPLVRQLTERVRAHDPSAAGFVHWGATSQDAIDTGLVLQLRGALEAIESELDRLAERLAQIADQHRDTLVAGRTWMQQAVPTRFGLKAAGWLDAVHRHQDRLAELRARGLALQFGGAVGSLSALGPRGLEVAAALAEELGLALPALPWHSHRDRLAEAATTLGLCTGTLGKIARDLALHAQTEVAEAFEPTASGRGASSTMPHKRNPVAAAVALAAAARVPGLVATMLGAMVQEHERGLGGWPAEWEVLPELVGLCGGALHHLTEALSGLRVDAGRMAANLEATQGLIHAEGVQMALAVQAGRGEARRIVEAACERARAEGRHLREVLADDPQARAHLPPAELQRLFDPRQPGLAGALIDRVLLARRSRRRVLRGGE